MNKLFSLWLHFVLFIVYFFVFGAVFYINTLVIVCLYLFISGGVKTALVALFLLILASVPLYFLNYLPYVFLKPQLVSIKEACYNRMLPNGNKEFSSKELLVIKLLYVIFAILGMAFGVFACISEAHNSQLFQQFTTLPKTEYQALLPIIAKLTELDQRETLATELSELAPTKDLLNLDDHELQKQIELAHLNNADALTTQTLEEFTKATQSLNDELARLQAENEVVEKFG